MRVITQLPSPNPYTLIFTVTNNRTGVEYRQVYQLYVTSRMGDGILVADTRDGRTSDISLVRNKYVSAGYAGETQYIRNTYSLMNGRTMEGVMRKIVYGPVGAPSQTFYLFAMTDQTLEALDAGSHGVSMDFDGLFSMPPARDREFQTIGMDTWSMFFVYGGDIYSFIRITLGAAMRFADPLNYVSPAQIANKKIGNEHALIYADLGAVMFLDETRGAFYCMAPSLYSIQPMTAGTNAGANFDPSALAGYKPIASCRGEKATSDCSRAYMLLESPEGTVDFYRLCVRWYPEEGVTRYESDGKFSAASCPDIRNARFFEGSYRRSVVYYATENKVYPCVIGGSAAGVDPSSAFTVPAGEEITAMTLFREAWSYYTIQNDKTMTVMPEDANQLLVATYNASTQEGKVYVLPISGNSGALGSADAERTFTGFGRITALGMQGKQ